MNLRLAPRSPRRPVALLAATLLTLVASAGVAAAHAKLESMTPSDGSTLAQPPRSVVLRFSEAVEAVGAEVVVTGPGGGDFSSGSPQVVGSVVTQPLAALTEAGRYRVDARIVSDDGHPITVTSSFTVEHGATSAGAAAPAAAAPGGGRSSGVVIAALILIVLVLVALAVVIVRRRPASESSP